MSQEILYTSAPHGLKPGSRGFCTVVSTSGMAKNLAERLESRSGYEHAFPAHDARASQNPVNYSHLTFHLGGRKYHLLSRICDAGLDYSKRSNKLAHHVVLEPDELVSGGPAWVLAGDGFCETSWDGNTRILPVGRKPRTDPAPTGVCQAWAKLAGDAGWAGVLAETIVEPRGKPMSVIFEPGTDTLALVVEAISLLSPERRWLVTFATYFTQLQTGLDCHWRFLLDGSREARAARRNPHSSLIDLCNSLDHAQGGRLVDAARSGKLPQAETTKQSPVVVAARRPVQRHGTDEAIDPDERLRHVPAPIVPPPKSETAQILECQFARRSRLPIVAVSCAITVVLFAVLTCGFFYLNSRGAGSTQTSQYVLRADTDDDKSGIRSPKEQSKASGTKPSNSVSPTLNSIHEQSPGPERSDAPNTDAHPTPDEALTEDVESNDSPVSEVITPLKDIRDRDRRLPLPALDIRTVPFGAPKTKTVELAKIFVNTPQECDLELVGSDRVLDSGQIFKMDVEDHEEKRTWKVHRWNKSSQGMQICTFTLQNQTLEFRWSDSQDARYAQPNLLRFCLLEVKEAGGDSVLCVMSDIGKQVEAAEINLKPTVSRIDLPLESDSTPPTKHLRLDLVFDGLPGDEFEIKNSSGLAPGEKCKVSIFYPNSRAVKKKEEFVDFEIEFHLDGSKHELLVKGWGYQMEKNGFPPTPKHIGPLLKELRDEDKRAQAGLKNLDDQIRDIEGKIAGFDNEIGKIEKEIEQTNNELKKLEEVKAAPDEEKIWKKNLSEIKQSIKKLEDRRQVEVQDREKKEKAKRKLEEMRKAVQESRDWLDTLSNMVGELQSDGRIGYRVYFEIEGETVDVLRSTPQA